MLNGGGSFHLHAAGADAPTRPPLRGRHRADICIIGAGFTGLWAAWWLQQVLPGRSIVLLEAERVGYGASGRNLGWLSGKPISPKVSHSETVNATLSPSTL